jgi:hypothetical protein
MTPEEQFSNVCNKMFEKLFTKLDDIDNRLFHDNGNESLQSKINRFGQWSENHDKIQTKTVSFWYWLIPIVISIGLIVLDRLWK